MRDLHEAAKDYKETHKEVQSLRILCAMQPSQERFEQLRSALARILGHTLEISEIALSGTVVGVDPLAKAAYEYRMAVLSFRDNSPDYDAHKAAELLNRVSDKLMELAAQ